MSDDPWLPGEFLPRGTPVVKTTGDYTFEGVIVSTIRKMSGVVRYVIEDDRGLLLIMNKRQFEVRL